MAAARADEGGSREHRCREAAVEHLHGEAAAGGRREHRCREATVGSRREAVEHVTGVGGQRH